MDLDLVFLGTAGSMPTAQRAPAALLVRHGGDRLLFDCAEGTQRQLLRSSVGLVELEEIFVTHFHADHILGLPGLFKTFSLRGRERLLEVYGPRGLVELLGSLKRVVGKLSYEVRVIELEPGDALERDGYRLATFAVSHGVPALGWSLIEATRPGRFNVEAADALLRRFAFLSYARLDDILVSYAAPGGGVGPGVGETVGDSSELCRGPAPPG